jgi:hypothetical protein
LRSILRSANSLSAARTASATMMTSPSAQLRRIATGTGHGSAWLVFTRYRRPPARGSSGS